MVEVFVLMDIRFAEPIWLFGLLVSLGGILLVVFLEKRKKTNFSKFASQSLWRQLAPELVWALLRRRYWLWLIGLAFVFLALSRPQWGTTEEKIKITGLDLVFALDISNSMQVEDVVPSRLKKAKHLIRSIVERLPGDRVALVPFAASSFLDVPLTTDKNYFLQVLAEVDSTWITNQGTDLGLALETGIKAI